MSIKSARRSTPLALACCLVLGGSLASVNRASAQSAQDYPGVPGSASALIFNQIFNVGGVGDRGEGGTHFYGSVGCGGTDNGGSLGGTSLSNALNAATGAPQSTRDKPGANQARDVARDLWRFCDNLYEFGGAWTTVFISPEDERLQSAGLAPDELFAQIQQAAVMTRALVRNVGSRAKQMRLAALGYKQEALMAGDGAVSVDVDGHSLSVDAVRGLNAGDELDSGLGSKVSIWANIRYVNIDGKTTPAEIGSATDGSGLTFGVDRRFGSKFYGGISVAVTSLSSEFDRIMNTRTGMSDVDNTALQLVWSYYPNERFYINGVVGFSDLSFKNTKYVPTLDINAPGSLGATPFAPLDSNPDGSTRFLNLDFGWDLRKTAVTVSPYLRLEYLKTNIDGFQERSRDNDNTLALAVDAQHNTSLTATAGVQVAFPRDTSSGIWTPYLSADLVRELKDQNDALRGHLALIDQAVFELPPTKTDKEYGFFGLGVSGQLKNGWALFIDYNSLFGYDVLDSWQATFGFRKEL